MLKYLILILFGLLSSVHNSLNAQVCGTHISPEKVIELENSLKAFNPNSRVENSLIDIPVKAHIIRRSDGSGGLTEAQLNSAMSTLNDFYTNSSIQFFLDGSINYIDNDDFFELDAAQEGSVAVPNDKRDVINVYFAESLTSGGSNLCGYTYFPPSADRIFMRNSCTTSGNTFAHEFGHYFTLYHTHGTTNTGTTDELVDGSNCESAGDRLCDTPADPNLSGVVNENCAYVGGSRDANGDLFSPMVPNIMSYAPGSCRDVFTAGQFNRIRTGFEAGRTYLEFTSSGFTAFFNSETEEVCVDNSVRFRALAAGATEFSWTFEGGTPATSTTQNPLVSYASGGTYNVRLVASTAAGQTAEFQINDYMTVNDPLSNVDNNVKSYQFIDTSIPEDLELINPDESISFSVTPTIDKNGNNSNVLFVNHYLYESERPGNRDVLQSSSFDITAMGKMRIRFDYAYTYKEGLLDIVPPITDSLKVKLEIACGQEKRDILVTGGEELATVEPIDTEFFPGTSEDWNTMEVEYRLSGNEEYIIVDFESISYAGNNLFIDNLELIPDYSVETPTNLIVNEALNGIRLIWEDNANNEEKYIVERSIDGGPYQNIGEVPNNQRTYLDSSNPEGNINYRVAGVSEIGEQSEYSNEAVYVVTSINPGISDGQIMVYPVPAKDILNIELLENLEEAEFVLVNIFGQEVLKGNILGIKEVNVSDLKSGSYILKILSKEKQQIKRVIKID